MTPPPLGDRDNVTPRPDVVVVMSPPITPRSDSDHSAGAGSEDNAGSEDYDFGCHLTDTDIARVLKMSEDQLLNLHNEPEAEDNGDDEEHEDDADAEADETEEEENPEPSMIIKKRQGWTYVPWQNKGWLVYPDGFPHTHLNAHCGNPDHGSRCHFNRQVVSTRLKLEPGHGRSAALSAAWLECTFDENCKTRKQHQDIKKVLASTEGFELRRDVRTRLETCGRSDIAYILENVETPALDDEELEVKKHKYTAGIA